MENEKLECVKVEKYIIYTNGDIINSNTGKKLKPIKTDKGYIVNLYLFNQGARKYYISRLIATLFLPIPDELKDYEVDKLKVDYLDGDRFNYNLNNLKWIKSLDHYRIWNQYMTENDLRKGHKILQDDGVIYKSVAEAARQLDTTKYYIRLALKTNKLINGHQLMLITED